jgi:hypothetical protein
MTAFNAVRFRVRPGHDQKFIDAHKNISWPGLRHAYMIKTGDHTYCIIAEWPGMETLAIARPNMIATLDFVPRHTRRSWRRPRCDRPSFGSACSDAQIAAVFA